MNLYGDNGNIRFLEKALNDQGQEVEITRKTVGDKLDDLNEYDVIYCGPGMESNRNVCLKHLSQYKKELLEAFNNDKVFLFTGIENVRFRRPVYPGDRLDLECRLLRHKLKLWKMEGRASVDGVVAAEAVLTAAVSDREDL